MPKNTSEFTFDHSKNLILLNKNISATKSWSGDEFEYIADTGELLMRMTTIRLAITDTGVFNFTFDYILPIAYPKTNPPFYAELANADGGLVEKVICEPQINTSCGTKRAYSATQDYDKRNYELIELAGFQPYSPKWFRCPG